ncbi:3-methyl-2-oxobutanoate hydroxymethyltransferase [Desulfallas thermosapovorans]|uniref:3-methyl-2-oxobutanoate hydroxymethyltransferase n=1 Tax=Desulfallas thermosapovorans DSM 6562 TaxID=1121431 RepID=A0A5S4ZXM7_9FIRM|nr:3-methyl-2-oxobutanoate hydroxymethyltransferase [Desulfallas thermosapovorans]TYO97772.1 ketopantoate hydroxymethyltransferase [Desulfallas thermosapovorans DSM 6562]
MEKQKASILKFKEMKKQGKKITMVTTYDFAMMSQVDKSDIDMILVGDSAANTMMGYEKTVQIDLDTMLVFCKAVANAGKHTFLVGDMPFMTYEINAEQAMANAGRIIREGRMDAVKLEGGERIANTVAALVRAGIPVMGHIGLTPQSAAQLGGFKVQGKNLKDAKQIVKDALALEKAGVFAIVLEAIPSPVAKIITESVQVPTIGIGAGNYCDGQVLVIHDLLGLFDRYTPKFVKRYANLGEEMQKALNTYANEVREGVFPDNEHSFSMPRELVEQLTDELKTEGIL